MFHDNNRDSEVWLFHDRDSEVWLCFMIGTVRSGCFMITIGTVRSGCVS